MCLALLLQEILFPQARQYHRLPPSVPAANFAFPWPTGSVPCSSRRWIASFTSLFTTGSGISFPTPTSGGTESTSTSLATSLSFKAECTDASTCISDVTVDSQFRWNRGGGKPPISAHTALNHLGAVSTIGTLPRVYSATLRITPKASVTSPHPHHTTTQPTFEPNQLRCPDPHKRSFLFCACSEMGSNGQTHSPSRPHVALHTTSAASLVSQCSDPNT